jgi:hypothetical protein
MSSAQVGIFLLCENRLLREALLRILGKRDNLKVLGACGYSPAALTELTALRLEVLLLDSHAFLHQAQCSVQNIRTLMVGMERISLMDRYHSRMTTTEVNSPTLTAAERF